jgi:hypothetical protein
MSIDQIRKEFMEKMDRLWTNQFDKAFKKIPKGSSHAYMRYADLLDDFFVYYWTFFYELSKGSTNERLSQVSDKMYKESEKTLEKVWHVTTDAQFDRVAELRRKRKTRKAAVRFLSRFKEAETLLKDSRDIDIMEKRLVKYRKASKLLAEFVKKVAKP